MLKRLASLAPYILRYRRKLILGILAILGSVVVGLQAPRLVGQVIDLLRRNPTRGTLFGYAGLLVGISLVQGTFSYIQRSILVGMSRDIEFDLRNDYFVSLQSKPAAFFHDHPTGDLMARATNDLQAVRMICGPAIMYSVNTVLTAAGALFFMARIDSRLTLLALVTMPVVVAATKLFGQRIHTLFERVQAQFSTLSARAQENLSGARVVRAYAQEEAEKAEFRRLNLEYVEGNRRLLRWSVAFHPLLQGLIGLGFAAVLWYGGRLVMANRITVGQFVTFNFYLARLIWPMIALGWVINLAQRGAASLGRIQSVLHAPPVNEEGALASAPPIQGALRFRDLSFSYRDPGAPVLAGIDLDVPAGRTVAVVGRTGAGKSTLLSLVPRLLEPPAGSLEVDGLEVHALPLSQLRAAMGMVPQETFLFSASLRDNIALGKSDASHEEILRAAHVAGLAADLAAFPHGLETLVGERGITLSGGQKQRVALARALLLEPRVLLLDDCLSAVDTHTEEEILRNLRQVFVGRTVFLVSHRISTVKEADLILVLDHGRIVERGAHAQLIASGGLYADLHQRQLLEEELAAAS